MDNILMKDLRQVKSHDFIKTMDLKLNLKS